jgi:hypothetical protein
VPLLAAAGVYREYYRDRPASHSRAERESAAT